MPSLTIEIQARVVKLLKLLAVAVIYILAYRTVADYLDPQGRANLFFMANGIALAALLLGGRLYAVSVFFGCLVANVWGGLSVSIALVIATGCTLNVLLGASLVTCKRHFDLSLKSLADYLHLIVFGGFWGSSVSALIGATTLQLAEITSSNLYYSELLNWLMEGTLGVVLVTPLILVWYKTPISHLFSSQNWLKIALIMVSAWFVGQIVFLGWFSDLFDPIAKGYWLFAIVTLAAIYLGKHGTLLILLIIAIQAVLGAMHNIGFFAHDFEQVQLLNLYFYTICLSLVGTALAIHIDERDTVEQELRESEDTFHHLFEDSNDAVLLIKNGVFVDCNTATLSLLTYTDKAQLINRSPSDISPIYQPDGRSSAEKVIENLSAIMTVGYSHFDWQHQRDDGSLFFVEVTLSKIMLQSEVVIHCSWRDISERKHMEEKLRDSENYFRRFVMQSPVAMAISTENQEVELLNERFIALFGYDQQDIPTLDAWWSKAYPDLVYRHKVEAVWRRIAEHAVTTKTDFETVEARVTCKNGEQRDIIFHGAFIGARLLVYFEDVTERNRIVSALRDSEERFKSIFNQAPLGIALVDSLTGQICAVNPKFAKIAGRSIEEMHLIDRISITHPDDIQRDLDNIALMNAGEINGFTMQKRLVHPDGSAVWINLTVAPMQVEDETHPHHHCIIEDITERRKLEKAQLFLFECGYKQTGEDFFASLARFLSEELDMDYVSIARLSADKLRAETVAVYADGNLQANQPYALANTPCGTLIGNTISCFPKNVRHVFPDLSLFQEMHAESYIGTTLWGFDGTPNGLIALISRNPLVNQPLAETLLKLVAIRAAGELERQQADTELRIAATVFESQEGMFIADTNNIILKVNHAFTEITGYTAAEVIGQNPRLMKSGRHDDAFYIALWDSVKNTGKWQGEIWNRRKNGEIYPQWLTITAVKANDSGLVTHYVATIIDITERKAAEEQIKQLAFYDVLTNLPNRRALSERMKYSINLARRENTLMAVLMLDLDKFKPVNDSLGHAAGDQLLQQVAARIKARLREVDMVARLGGDEFVVLLDDINQNEDVERVAKDIIETLSQLFVLNKSDNVQIGTSIGISLYPQHGDSPEILLDNADAALYLAKKRGRGCLAYFCEQLTQVAHERIALEARLRQAVEQHELCVHYQAQIDSVTGRIIGAEALVRWQDPSVGLIFPDDFMPLAETSNLFSVIGAWVLKEACQQGRQWLDAGLPALTLTVNVSPQQFRRTDISDLVMTVLAETAFPATQLELEITEAALMANQEYAPIILTTLNNQGILLAIENFGTGYSSFAALKHFPLTTLKIDKTFINDIPLSPSGMTITATIIDMAHNLGFKVLAKSVETSEQLAFLQQRGCDYYQGFYYSEALTASAFAELLRKMAV